MADMARSGRRVGFRTLDAGRYHSGRLWDPRVGRREAGRARKGLKKGSVRGTD